MTIHHADFTIERQFRQSPVQVFSAFAQPALREQWFANAGNFEDHEWSLDFRVGGGEVNAGKSPGRSHHAFKSRFHDIVEGERIVFAYDLLIDHELISVSLATYEFRPDGDGTRMIFSEQGVFFGGKVAADQREEGSNKLVDLLESFLNNHWSQGEV